MLRELLTRFFYLPASHSPQPIVDVASSLDEVMSRRRFFREATRAVVETRKQSLAPGYYQVSWPDAFRVITPRNDGKGRFDDHIYGQGAIFNVTEEDYVGYVSGLLTNNNGRQFQFDHAFSVFVSPPGGNMTIAGITPLTELYRIARTNSDLMAMLRDVAEKIDLDLDRHMENLRVKEPGS